MTSNVGIATGTAFAGWGEVFTLPVHEIWKGDVKDTFSQPGLTLECSDKGLVSVAYGKIQCIHTHIYAYSYIQFHHMAIYIYVYICEGRAYMSQSFLLNGIQDVDQIEEGVVSTYEYALDGDKGQALNGLVDPSTVVVRFMTCLVKGAAIGSNYQNNLAKLRARAADAIEERRILVERQQQLAERSKGNDDGSNSHNHGVDDIFILDPSLLTVQDLKVNISLSRVKALLGAVYICEEVDNNKKVDNPNKQMDAKSQRQNVPLVLIDMKDVGATIVAKNNPWDVQFSVSLGALKIHDEEAKRRQKTMKLMSSSINQGQNINKNVNTAISRVDPIISIPNASITVSMLQTSSIGRYIDGSLDVSCFEWSAEIKFMTYKMQLKPSTQPSGHPVNMRSLWKTYRILEHLWMPKFAFGLGHAIMSLGGEGDTKTQVSSEESTLRLGGMYDEFPIHVNYCKEILGG